MNRNFRNFRLMNILGIPIEVNPSWLVTLAFVTSILALRLYPRVLPAESPYRDDVVLHWAMALASGFVFFASVVLHELAHSVMARRQGIQVKAITLFIFGGVSQIAGDARRPLHEFLIAIVGPLTSVLLAGAFFGVFWISGISDAGPVGIVLQWLFVMNLVVAAFNMAPGFPMDGGRVLRSLLWGLSGNFLRATRLSTIVGRAMGYSMMFIGGLAIFNVISVIDPWSGLWFGVLGMFLEGSARQSWFQARALEALSKYKAEEIMTAELETAGLDERVEYLVSRGGRRFIFFVSDEDRVVGVLTEKETAGFNARRAKTQGDAPARDSSVIAVRAEDLMLRPDQAATARPEDNGAALLQSMEAASVWHLPIVREGRVIGVVSKENLLRLLARKLVPRANLAGQP